MSVLPTILADALAEEMDARGWVAESVAARMGPTGRYGENLSVVAGLLDGAGHLFNADIAARLAEAFDVPALFFSNLMVIEREGAGR